MSWADGDLYGFDTETGGVSVFDDRIVSATVVKVSDGKEVDKRTWLINSGVPIPEAAQKVHGITTEHVTEHGMDPATAIEEIAATVTGVLRSGRTLVGFNCAFDFSILDVECKRYDLPRLGQRINSPSDWHYLIDGMVLGKGVDTIRDRKFVKGRKFTLPALCEWYKVPFAETHDATADATGAVLLARAIAQSDPYLAVMGPSELHQVQVTWRREMQRSLREFFDREGKEHDGCDGSWPLHSDLMQGVKA